MSGRKVTSRRATTIAMYSGMSARLTSVMRAPETLQPRKSTLPTGGVQRPMQRFKTITIPKCTGSTPIDWTTGSSIGVKMSTAGVMSRTVPTTSRTTLIDRSVAIGASAEQRERFAHELRDALVGEHPGKSHRSSHEEQHDGCRNRGVDESLGDLPKRDLPIDGHREHKAVDHRDGARFGRGEGAADDPSHDEHDKKQARQRGEKASEDLARGDRGVHGIASLFGDETRHRHECYAHEKSWEIARYEEGGDGDPSARKRIDDENVARGMMRLVVAELTLTAALKLVS